MIQQKRNSIPVVILAGGFGTRLREETEFRPKPMVMIGGKPILWHIMKLYSFYGFNRFIICLGYKGEIIKDYFVHYRFQNVDITINTKTGTIREHCSNDEEWEVTLADTGHDCMTGGRLARVADYIDTDTFMLTYGDGVSDVNIADLLRFHIEHKKMASLSGIRLPFRFGNLVVEGDSVKHFIEKEDSGDRWINGGFFVFNKKFFEYLSADSHCILEQQPLRAVAQQGELMVFKHRGFWACMDTLRDHEYLKKLWDEGKAPWKLWSDHPRPITPAHKTHMEIVSCTTELSL